MLICFVNSYINSGIVCCTLSIIGSLDVMCDKVLHQNIVSSEVLSLMTCDMVDKPQLSETALVLPRLGSEPLETSSELEPNRWFSSSSAEVQWVRTSAEPV